VARFDGAVYKGLSPARLAGRTVELRVFDRPRITAPPIVFGIADDSSLIAAVPAFRLIARPGTVTVLTAAATGAPTGGHAGLGVLLLGDWMRMAAAVIGVAARLTVQLSFVSMMQYLGAACLLWAGRQLFRARSDPPSSLALRSGRHVRHAFLIT
jgi:threonine/homoserine/homoserine lactone efflux protein